jgi:hypothetical protein
MGLGGIMSALNLPKKKLGTKLEYRYKTYITKLVMEFPTLGIIARS